MLDKEDQFDEIAAIVSTAYDRAKCDRKTVFSQKYAAEALQRNHYYKAESIIDELVERLSPYFNTERLKAVAAEFKEDLKK